MSTLEIILPLRNPTAVFEQTVNSLIAQTDRVFTVLVSDNFSTKGMELIAAAIGQLQAAGIAVRQIRPPVELGRVEHWNWAHYQATGDWLKPLFAGDWLEPDYVAKLRAGVAANPQCHYVFALYTLHQGGVPEDVPNPWVGEFQPPEKMQRVVLRCGMQFGPPSAAAYERTAFISVGGYPTPLPICADCLMFCTLAARFGALGLAEPLCHFNIHDARFSTNLGQRRRDYFHECLTYLLMLAYHAWTERAAFSITRFARLLAWETRGYLFKK